MNWLGKCLGFIFGLLMMGPTGAFLGILIGHAFDRSFNKSYTRSHPFSLFGTTNKTKKIFFYTLFSCMGRLSKSDGKVSSSEIKTARKIMHDLGLNTEQTSAAIDAFRSGKDENFNIHYYLRQLKVQAGSDKQLLHIFIEYQLHAAYADGGITQQGINLLLSMAESLGINRAVFNNIHKKFKAQRDFKRQFEEQFGKRSSSGYQSRYKAGYQQEDTKNYQKSYSSNYNTNNLQNAYTILGVKSNDDKMTVKKAYRKQMNNYHPDKLAAKGLPDDLIKASTEKTQNIKASYDLIKQQNGW